MSLELLSQFSPFHTSLWFSPSLDLPLFIGNHRLFKSATFLFILLKQRYSDAFHTIQSSKYVKIFNIFIQLLVHLTIPDNAMVGKNGQKALL